MAVLIILIHCQIKLIIIKINDKNVLGKYLVPRIVPTHYVEYTHEK